MNFYVKERAPTKSYIRKSKSSTNNRKKTHVNFAFHISFIASYSFFDNRLFYAYALPMWWSRKTEKRDSGADVIVENLNKEWFSSPQNNSSNEDVVIADTADYDDDNNDNDSSFTRFIVVFRLLFNFQSNFLFSFCFFRLRPCRTINMHTITMHKHTRTYVEKKD